MKKCILYLIPCLILAVVGPFLSSSVLAADKVVVVPLLTASSSLWTPDGSNIYFNGGNVGIGTDSPGYRLHIKDNIHGAWMVGIHNTGLVANDYGLVVRADGGDPFLVQTNAGTSVLRVKQNGRVGIGVFDPGYTLTVNGTTYCTSGTWSGSDQRWKKDVEPLADPLPKVMKLRGVTYDWKRKAYPEKKFPQGRQLGLIAQEVEKEFPELVTTDPEGYKGVSYDKLSVILLETVKAQQAMIKSQERRIRQLEKKMAEL